VAVFSPHALGVVGTTSFLRIFFQCSNDPSRALLMRLMTAVVNYKQAGVWQITRKALSKPQWDQFVFTTPNDWAGR
jgi:hypothetical protein